MTIKQNFKKIINKLKKIKLKTKEELRQAILDSNNQYDDFNNKYDYSSITDFSYLLDSCNSITSIPFLETKNVTNMEGMFAHTEIKHIVLGDTSNVTNMNKLAYMNNSLITIKFLSSNFDNTKKIKTMNKAFLECWKLEEVIGLDTLNIDTMDLIYGRCLNLKKITKIDFSKHDFKNIFKDTPIRTEEKYLKIVN